MLTFDTDEMVQQNFPFPAPLMDYIFKNLTASQLLKLYKTCKFFYDKFRLNIIEHFEICDNEDDGQRIIGNSMAITLTNPSWLKLNNLWISKSFTYCENKDDVEPTELDHKKFSRLTYSMLDMFGKHSVADYEFLVQCPSLRHLIIRGCVCSGEKRYLSIADIIERAPHVSMINLSRQHIIQSYPPIDMTKLLSLKRETKLTSLQLCNVLKISDPLLVVEFFMKHGVPEIDYYFGYDKHDAEYNVENAKRFYKTVDDGLRAWKLSLEIPPAISSSFIDLTGKTAVITGASEGIGRATVILFRQLGASVIAVSRNHEQLLTLMDECQNIKNDGFLHVFWTPFLYNANIDDIFTRVDFKFGTKFDILVNNSDTFGWGGVPDIEYEQEYCLNLYTIADCHNRLIEDAKPYMIKAKGHIINISYPDGLITMPGSTSFINAVNRRIKNIERKLISSGVRINTVNPGTPPTTLPRPKRMTDIDYEKFEQESKKSYEKEVANTIAYLASDAAKLIDESTLNVNPMKLH